DGCNLGFIPVSPRYSVGQQCVNTVEEPAKISNCSEHVMIPWCFAFLTAEVDGGLTTVHRGCRSRKTMMHHISKDQHTKFKITQIGWIPSVLLVCLHVVILHGAWTIRMALKQCALIFYSRYEDEVEKKGRLCCCRGNHKCNERFMWGDDSISEKELAEKMIRKRATALLLVVLPRVWPLLVFC
ncbi:hypothetical protein OSTOST_25478, partial [Ostertagia ostertagi]